MNHPPQEEGFWSAHPQIPPPPAYSNQFRSPVIPPPPTAHRPPPAALAPALPGPDVASSTPAWKQWTVLVGTVSILTALVSGLGSLSEPGRSPQASSQTGSQTAVQTEVRELPDVDKFIEGIEIRAGGAEVSKLGLDRSTLVDYGIQSCEIGNGYVRGTRPDPFEMFATVLAFDFGHLDVRHDRAASAILRAADGSLCDRVP